MVKSKKQINDDGVDIFFWVLMMLFRKRYTMVKKHMCGDNDDLPIFYFSSIFLHPHLAKKKKVEKWNHFSIETSKE